MKATVTQLISGEDYTDKQRRVQLKFEGASLGFGEIRVPVAALGVEGVALDDVLEVRISRAKATEHITPATGDSLRHIFTRENVEDAGKRAVARVAEGKW
jgi:hypothetical protein